MNFDHHWQKALNRRQDQHLARVSHVIEHRAGVNIRVDGRDYINFSSNDYLGLALDERIKAAFKLGIDRWGVGATASHLVCGHTSAHQALTQTLADCMGRQAVMLFSTGYMANLGLLQALSQRHGWIAADRLNHASLVDAALASRAQTIRYAHANAADLAQQLANHTRAVERSGLIVTDAVFSMDGDIAPIESLSRLADAYGACLAVDDAHGFGVLGDGLTGTLGDLGLTNHQVPVYMATLGKALGVSGAFVAGSETLIQYLTQFARTYAYTTALPPALAEAALAAIEIVLNEPWRQQHTRELAAYFRERAGVMGYALIESNTPIQCVVVGSAERALRLSRTLAEAGFWVPAIRPPTVPTGQARLRVTLSAHHTYPQVDRLLNVFEKQLDCSVGQVTREIIH